MAAAELGAQQRQALSAAVLSGDLSGATPEQRVEWYLMRCAAAGLDPRTKPFDYIKTQQGLSLYANKTAADQLCQERGLSTRVLSTRVEEEIFIAHVQAVARDGRTTEDIGAVAIGNLRGEARANAMMKAITKGKRRTILSLCGLGMIDESEVDTIPGARRVSVDFRTGEVLDGEPAALSGPDPEAANRRLFAAAREAGVDTKDKAWMRAIAGEALELGRPADRLSALTGEQRVIVADFVQRNPGLCLELRPQQEKPAAVEGEVVADTPAADDPFVDRVTQTMEQSASYGAALGL
jgi:hypothetical protein